MQPEEHFLCHSHVSPPTSRFNTRQVSKEVAKLRDYESALLKHYQSFLKAILAASKAAQWPAAHVRVAVRCMCQLLTTAPHFNYTWVVAALVPGVHTHTRLCACLRACGAGSARAALQWRAPNQAPAHMHASRH